MELQRFTSGLTELYEAWGRPAVCPRSGRFSEVLREVRGMTSACVLQLLNSAVNLLGDDEAYLEVCTFQGATLVGALLDNPTREAYAVDDFSQFDPQGVNRTVLSQNLASFGLDEQVRLVDQNFEEFFVRLRSGPKIGVYFYDGAHDYRSQLMGVLLEAPHLAQRALVVVDDANGAGTKQAVWDFLAVQRECRLLLELLTPGNCHPTFWNGLYVLGWETGSDNSYATAFLRRGRQLGLLESLDLSQQLELRRN